MVPIPPRVASARILLPDGRQMTPSFPHVPINLRIFETRFWSLFMRESDEFCFYVPNAVRNFPKLVLGWRRVGLNEHCDALYAAHDAICRCGQQILVQVKQDAAGANHLFSVLTPADNAPLWLVAHKSLDLATNSKPDAVLGKEPDEKRDAGPPGGEEMMKTCRFAGLALRVPNQEVGSLGTDGLRLALSVIGSLRPQETFPAPGTVAAIGGIARDGTITGLDTSTGRLLDVLIAACSNSDQVRTIILPRHAAAKAAKSLADRRINNIKLVPVGSLFEAIGAAYMARVRA